MKRILSFFALSLLIIAGISVECRAQEFALSTNMLDYANLGTLNLKASYGFARHWSIDAGMKYNPFSFNTGEGEARNRQLSYSAGAKYWPWHIYSGWWVSGGVRYQEYNSGGISSVQTSEGDRFGGSLGGGYTYMLSPHFNIDFGLGLWAGYDIFTTYACQSCGKVVSEGGKYFVRPSDVTLALTYIF